MNQLLTSIKKEVDDTKEWVKGQVRAVKVELLSHVTTKWKLYNNAVKLYNTEKDGYNQMQEGESKNAKREKLHLLLDGRLKTLDTLETALGELDSATLAEFDINLPVNDKNVPINKTLMKTEQTACFLERKRLQNQPIPVNEENMEEELAYMAEKYKAFKVLETGFNKAFEDYKKAHPDAPLSSVPSVKEVFDAQLKVKELGQQAMGLIGNLNGRVREVIKFADSDMLAESDTMIAQPKLLLNIQMDNKTFTKDFMAALRDGKAKPVTVPVEKVQHRENLRDYINKEINMSEMLPADEIAEGFVNAIAGGSEHPLALNCMGLLLDAKKYQESINKKGIADRIGDLRQQLYNLRNNFQIWLQHYAKAEKAGEFSTEDAKKLAKFKADIEKLMPVLQQNLVAIGSYEVLHDNYSDIISTFNKISLQLEDTHDAKNELQALQEHINEGDNKEEFKKKATAFAKQKDEVKEAINRFASLANTWCVQHSEVDFGINLKREELQDKTRDLILRANELGVTDISTSNFEALSDLIPETYDESSDTVLKKILSKSETLKELESSTDYKKRFTKLGDLNDLLQKWEFKHRHYRESLIATAKVKHDKASKYFEHQYNIVNAMMSISQLDKGMHKDYLNYIDLVSDYNESKEEYRGDLPALLHGSNRLLEFIEVWMKQYEKAADAAKEMKQPMPEAIETRKKKLLEVKDIIENNNLGIISSMKDFDNVRKLEEQLKKTHNQIESKRGDRMALQDKLKHLRSNLEHLQKETPVNDEKIDQIKNRINKLRVNVRKINKELVSLKKDKEELSKKTEVEREELTKEDKGASSTFVRLMAMVQSRSSFEYTPGLNELEYSERWNGISYLLSLVVEWRGKVIDPNLPSLAEYRKAVDGIEFDLLRQRQQFMDNKAYQDKLYPRVETAWNIVKSDKDNNVNTEEALLRVNYCLKITNYWFKENAVEIESEKDKRKQLHKWQKELNAEISGGRFKALKRRKLLQASLEELEELIKSVRNDLNARHKELMGNSIFNVNNPEGESALMDWIRNFTQIVNSIDTKKASLAEKALKEDRLDDAEGHISKLLEEITNEYQNSQLALTKQVKQAESLVFAGLGDGDYDYENSGQFSPEQIDLMNKTMSNAVARATALMESGANLSQIYESVAHLPSSMLPDEFIEQLNAFKITEKAFKEEEQQKALEEAATELGISDILLDVDTTQQIAAITESLSGISELTTYKKWVEDEKGGSYSDFVVGSNEKQGQGHKNAGFALAFLDTVAGSMEDFLALKNLSPEEKQREVAEYLFKGGVNFEDEDGDIGHATTSNAKVLEISQRKRTILLTGMHFVSKVSGLIDSGADAFDGSKELQAATKSIAFFVGKLAELVDKGSSPEEIARTTNQLWKDRIDSLSTIAEGLLASGKTIAQTVGLFSQLPAGLIPGLGLAANLLSLSLDIKGIAEKMIERHATKKLLQEAEIYDRKYVGPLKQEISSLNRRIAKQSVDVAITTLQIAGNITTLAGHPEAGAAIAIVAGVLSIGNKLVFEGINEAMLKDARDTLKKAQAGDREAQIKIMEKSPVYAKMLIAVGCTNEPPDAIALEFVRQRGITEKDIRDAGTSKYIVRRFLRKKLLEHSEESDSHDGKLGIFKGLAAKWKAWRAQVHKKEGFWNGDGQNYKTLLEIYPGAKLQKLVDDSVVNLKGITPELLELLEIDKVTDLQLYEDIKAIYKILSEQNLFVENQYRLKKRDLDNEIEADQNDKEKDHAPIVLRLEQDVADLETQKKELVLLIGTLELLDSTEIPLKA